ncbi:MAG TPA: phytanoyl-CoA dioxygenase family protein [Gammaproteobacteria bacterium]|jgi:ectoine hydroxylase-related dioxygenase (phytanoyl-CoA dioxygenase family)|nr:phytanoyl-CoA dioxygenase family protein [Gammaproteobacteria bacterium]
MNIEQALQGNYSFSVHPEMALQQYQELGFHVEKNLFDLAYCDFLIEQAYTLPAAQVKNFKPVLMPHKENPVFLEAMKNAKVVNVMEKLVGGTPAGIQTQFFYCKPGTRGFSLHQDNFYVQAEHNQFVSIWVALVDTFPGNGGMIIYPGSHKEGDLPVRKLDLELDPGQDRNANNEETVVPEAYRPVHLTLQKGSALFIHAHLVHGSNTNQSDQSRYALLNLYIREGTAFRSGNSAQRIPITL